MKVLIFGLLVVFCVGCSSSGAKSSSVGNQPKPSVNPTPMTAQQNGPTVWQENFNRQQAQQNKKTQDDRYRDETRRMYEQQQRDNFRRLSKSHQSLNEK